MHFAPLSQLKPEPVEWFWPGYLAAGSLAILDGDPGQGKSLVTLDLAARITTGRPWPDGAPMKAAAPVLFLCCEDVDAVVHSRLQSAGADLDRVFLWPRQTAANAPTNATATQANHHADAGLPLFPTDLLRLELALMQTQAKFVVIDPIASFLDRSVMSASDASVRRALRPLARLADKHGCVILLVRHLNKSATGQALYRGGGSIGFVAACRLAWLAAPDPRDEDRFVLAQVKNNYAPRQTSLSYSIADPESPTRVREDATACPEAPTFASRTSSDAHPRIDWLGAIPWTADELSTRRPHPSRRRARDFLKRVLAAGPRTSEEIWSAASKAGLSRKTLYRAKEDLDVRILRSHDGPKRFASWSLPHHVPATPSDTPALDAWLNRWHELHAEPPLDDFESFAPSS